MPLAAREFRPGPGPEIHSSGQEIHSNETLQNMVTRKCCAVAFC